MRLGDTEVISSTAQAHSRYESYDPLQATPCATIGNHERRKLVNYARES